MFVSQPKARELCVTLYTVVKRATVVLRDETHVRKSFERERMRQRERGRGEG